MELQSVYNSGTGTRQALVQAIVPGFNCPSRRGPNLRPACCTPANLGAPTPNQAKSDYAANYGDAQTVSDTAIYGNPASSSCPCTLYAASPANVAAGQSAAFRWPDTSRITGIVFVRSSVRMKDVTDGLSKTYAVGEKYLNPDKYEDGSDGGDDWSIFTGHQDDTLRTTHFNANLDCSPLQDRGGVQGAFCFGSAHPGGFQMAMCDGSTHTVSYGVASEIHRRLGNRSDGLTASVNDEAGPAGPGTAYCP